MIVIWTHFSFLSLQSIFCARWRSVANDALPVIVVNNQAETRALCTAHAMEAHCPLENVTWIRFSVLVMCCSNTSDPPNWLHITFKHIFYTFMALEKQTF